MSNPQQIPSFYASILFQARLNPHAMAVAYTSHTLTYRTFCEHVEAVTRRLNAQGLSPGTRVGIAVQEGYMKWLVVIALARMGLVSISLSGYAGELSFVGAQAVVTDSQPPEGVRAIAMDPDWVREAEHLPPFVDRLHEPDAPCRIVLSSGTTGTPKKALFTYGHFRARSRGTARAFGMNVATRALTTMNITTIGGFWTPVSVWSNGGLVVLTQPRPGQSWSTVVVRSRPNLLFTSTAQLGGIVNSLPVDFYPGEHLAAYVAGSALPLALNRRARLKLTESLFVIYGSTEAGTTAIAHASMADTRPEFTGYVLPTAQVEVVDEAGLPVPNGTMGEVRIRADGLVDEYLEDTAANDGSFRAGWFHPGDAGILDDLGGISIVGRTRELMNFGGVKVSPDSIEATLAGMPGIDDMAVFSIQRAGEHPRPCAAVVAGEDYDEESLLRAFQRNWRMLPALLVARVSSIPRNEMGKVLRTQLAADVRKSLPAKA